MPNFSYIRLPDGKATVTCTCGWKDPLGPQPPSPFDPAEALTAAGVEHLNCLDLTDDEIEAARMLMEGIPGSDHPGSVYAMLTQALAQIERLRARQDELLATIVRVTNETPYPDEIKGWEGQRAKMIAEIGTLRDAVRFAEAVRDDARAASNRYLEEKRSAENANEHYAALLAVQEKHIVEANRSWATGVRACIDTVKQRHEHYEMYRCDCLDRDPGNGHRPGCKAEMMSTHPATFAILDEIYTFLSALLSRGERP